jgi:hypothetical protein
MKDLGYGKGYERYTRDDLLPDELKGTKYLAEPRGAGEASAKPKNKRGSR